MTQASFYRQVARATGESARSIRRRGFSIVDLGQECSRVDEENHPPQWVDWDEVDKQRHEAA